MIAYALIGPVQTSPLFFFDTFLSIIGGSQVDPDNDWKPHKKARHTDDEDEENSTDESELNLLKDEAAEFVQNSSITHPRTAKKKARIHVADDDD